MIAGGFLAYPNVFVITSNQHKVFPETVDLSPT
jgi:hypothetical protein